MSDTLNHSPEELEAIAADFLSQDKLTNLDQIAKELYGPDVTFRTLSAFGQHMIANRLLTDEPDRDVELESAISKLAAEERRANELEEQLREAWDTIEELEIALFDKDMENLRLKSATTRRRRR